MANQLEKYLKKKAKALQLDSLVLSDTSGVEIGRYGRPIPNLQLLSAIFQSTIENTGKISVGETSSITLIYNGQVFIQKSLGSLVLTILMKDSESIGRVMATFPHMQEDLAPLLKIIS